MILSGTVQKGDDLKFLYVQQTTSVINYILVSPYHVEDIFSLAMGDKAKHPVKSISQLESKGDFDSNYVIASIKYTTKDKLYFGNATEVLSVIDVLQEYMNKQFKESEISINKTEENKRLFSATTSSESFEYIKEDGFISKFSLDNAEYSINLFQGFLKLPRALNLDYKEYTKADAKRMFVNLQQISYEELQAIYDLSYQESQDFKSVKTIDAFEDMFEEFLIYHQEQKALGNITYLANDVETDGLEAFDLPANLASEICAISLAWKIGQSRLIFTNMVYHDNITMEYIKERLGPIFRKDFHRTQAKNKFTIMCKGKEYEVDRDKLYLVNTNTMFDQRSYLVHGVDIFYDMDLMMLYFALSPFHTKGNKSLKSLTERFLNRKALSLKETLGKGNEDKFRWIHDERVAIAYACPDTASLLEILYKILEVYKELNKSFFQKDLLKVIQSQYPIIQYIHAVSDFHGMRVMVDNFLAEGSKIKRRIQIIDDYLRHLIGYNTEVNKYKKILHLAKQQGVKINLPAPKFDTSVPYSGKLAGKQLRKALYEDLEYIPVAYTRPSKTLEDPSKHVPLPSLDKHAMKELAKIKNNRTQGVVFTQDLIDPEDGTVIISKEELNATRHPEALCLSIKQPIQTEYTSYFKPFEELLQYDTRIFKTTSTTNIDTFRMANALQIIKKKIKEMLVAFGDKYKLVVWDKAQIELRVAAAISGFTDMVNIMDNPRSDVHKERAALAAGIKPHQVTGEQRSKVKSTVFGGIYGQEVYGLCMDMFGSFSQEYLAIASEQFQFTKKAYKLIFDFLDKIKEQVLTPVEIPKILRDTIGLKEGEEYSVIFSEAGYYKIFHLKKGMTDKEKRRLSNQATNFPVQSFAGFIFKNSIIKLFYELWERNWWQSKSYMIHASVHDELVGSYDFTKICLEELASVLYKSCVYKLPGHPTYYIGLSIADNWYECKTGLEMPIALLKEMAEEWDAGKVVPDYETDARVQFETRIKKFAVKEVKEELQKIYPDLLEGKLDIRKLDEVLESYYIRDKISLVSKNLWKPEKGNLLDELASEIVYFYFKYIGDELLYKDKNLPSLVRIKSSVMELQELRLSFTEFFSPDRKKIVSEKQLRLLEDNIELESDFSKDDIMSQDERMFYNNLNWSLDSDEEGGFSSTSFGDYTESKYARDDKLLQNQEDEGLVPENIPEGYFKNDKGLLERKVPKIEYVNITLLNKMAYVKLPRNNHSQLVLNQLEEINKNYLISNDRVKLIFKINSIDKTIIGPEVEKRALLDIDEFINSI